MADHHPRALVVLNRPSAAALPHEASAPAFRLVDPGRPVLSALDQGATRGDGVFETIGVVHGHPQALEHHLRRFERGAAALDLPAPDLDAYRAAIADCPLWPRDETSARKLLSLFLIEKAALEIEYEIGNRPSWAGVPLAGLRALLHDRQPAETPTSRQA